MVFLFFRYNRRNEKKGFKTMFKNIIRFGYVLSLFFCFGYGIPFMLEENMLQMFISRSLLNIVFHGLIILPFIRSNMSRSFIVLFVFGFSILRGGSLLTRSHLPGDFGIVFDVVEGIGLLLFVYVYILKPTYIQKITMKTKAL